MAKTDVEKLVDRAIDAGAGVLRLAPTWVPRSFLTPGYRLKLAPEDASVRYRRAFLLRRRGRNEEALKEYDRAIGIAPDHGPAHADRAGLLFQLERYADAAAAYGRAAEIGREVGLTEAALFAKLSEFFRAYVQLLTSVLYHSSNSGKRPECLRKAHPSVG